MNQPTREEFEAFKQEIRQEVQRIERETEPMRLERRLSIPEANTLQTIMEMVGRQGPDIATLKIHMESVKTDITAIKETMATKEGLATLKTAQDARFDQLEAARDEHNRKLDEQHDMLRQILRILGQQPDQEQS